MSPVCFVTQVLSTLRGSAPIARCKGSPQSSALRLCRPPLRCALSVPPAAPSPRVGDTPPLDACYPRLRQVAFGMYMPRSTRTCKRKSGRPDANHHTSHTKPLHMAAICQRANGRLPPRRGHRRPRGIGLLRRYSHRLLPHLRRGSWECPRGTSQRWAGRHHHNPHHPCTRLARRETPSAPCITTAPQPKGETT
jgi:hypothetical protein